MQSVGPSKTAKTNKKKNPGDDVQSVGPSKTAKTNKKRIAVGTKTTLPNQRGKAKGTKATVKQPGQPIRKLVWFTANLPTKRGRPIYLTVLHFL